MLRISLLTVHPQLLCGLLFCAKIQPQMRKLLLLLIALTMVLFGCSCTKRVAELNYWTKEVPVINGELSEWRNLQRSAKQKAFQYEISNDEKYLYIGFRVIDPRVQTNIMKRGLTIWFDTTGRRKRYIGVGYPLALSESAAEKMAIEAGGNPVKMNAIYTEFAQDFDLLGYTDEALRVSNLTSRDMKVGAGFDKLQNLVCEIKFPLKQIFGKYYALNKIFGINFKVNEEKKIAENEASLFDDPSSNAITQSNLLRQTPNRVGQPGQQIPTNAPLNSQSGTKTNIWLMQQLVEE